MAVFLIECLAILMFIKLADWSRFAQLFPIVITGILLRFLDHYIIIDWLHIWKIPAPRWLSFWIPISANLTIWPIFSYLYIQFLPTKRQLIYSGFWLAGILLYLKCLQSLHVFVIHKHWNFFYSGINISFFLFCIYILWRWLQPGLVRNKRNEIDSYR